MARSTVAWVLATTVGFTAGGLLFHFPGSVGEQAGWSATAAIFGVTLGAITGVVVGLCQWATLRLRSRAGGRLVLAMALAIALTHGLVDASPIGVSLVLLAAAAGIGTAIVFRVLLPAEASGAGTAMGAGWALGILLGAVLGDAIGLPLEETQLGWALDHTFDGLVGGLVIGIAGAVADLPARLRTIAGVDTTPRVASAAAVTQR